MSRIAVIHVEAGGATQPVQGQPGLHEILPHHANNEKAWGPNACRLGCFLMPNPSAREMHLCPLTQGTQMALESRGTEEPPWQCNPGQPCSF